MTSRYKIGERALGVNEFVERSSLPTSLDHPDKVAILVPGIRTNADWIDRVSSRLETFSAPIIVVKAYGGVISAGHLITRIGLKEIREEVKTQILHVLLDHRDKEISLICHSMGTDLIADILDEIRYRFKFIFFLGGVCHVRKATRISKSCDFFINHRGTFDYWPIIAATIRQISYSPSGTFGFNRTAFVNDLIFNNNHETCTDQHHIFNYVLPVITGSRPIYPETVICPFDVNRCAYIKWAIYSSIIIGAAGIYFTIFSAIFPLLVLVLALLYYLKKRPIPAPEMRNL
jgi:hypothetical protein